MALKMPKLFGEPKAKLAATDGDVDVPTTQVRMSPAAPSGYDPLATVSVMEQLRAATAKSVDRSSFMFHYAYLNENIPESRRDQIGWVVSRVNDPSRAADISARIGMLDVTLDEDLVQSTAEYLKRLQASRDALAEIGRSGAA